MTDNKPRFDHLSSSYDELLRDPIRDRFTGAETAFFHHRKRDLIRDYFRRRAVKTTGMSYLDVGCGKGELLTSLRSDFRHVAGCDVSAEMLRSIQGVETRVQTDPMKIPFDSESYDFITSVCVYHHVPVAARPQLTSEVVRVLKPGGVFAVIEHNPLNPATRLIVSRTPVDADAILLPSGETRRLMQGSGLTLNDLWYFLYFPEAVYRRIGVAEWFLRKIPLGGQYVTFAVKQG
jgi:ubiquinone/menaquinone biosynthesis C-methylase UbiE